MIILKQRSYEKVIFFRHHGAECHLAFGASYPTTVKGGNSMTAEQLDQHGMNSSIQHVDFMVGTKDIDIDGIGFDGEVVPLFRDGEWVI